MSTIADLLCSDFIDKNTLIFIKSGKKIEYRGRYTDMDNRFFSSFVVGFSYNTYKNILNISIL